MSLADILADFVAGDSLSTDIPANWLQGRTAYGGLSAAIALTAARTIEDGLPPLGSGQVAFAGPLAGRVTAMPKLLRRGRNTAFVQVTLESEAGIGLLATFIFMNPRASKIVFDRLEKPELPEIPADGETRSGPPEFFTSQFQYPEKRLIMGHGEARLANWHRLTERDGLDPATELVCMGDALPPAAMGMMTESAPVSSMNWQFNLLTSQPQTENGWWFVEADAHYASGGSSSQHMTLWNSRGEPMMTGTQAVTIFA